MGVEWALCLSNAFDVDTSSLSEWLVVLLWMFSLESDTTPKTCLEEDLLNDIDGWVKIYVFSFHNDLLLFGCKG